MTRRKDRPLAPEDLAPDPIAAFRAWYAKAVETKVPMPEAMALATASAAGIPSLRWVLFKGIDDTGGLTFFTSYESRKAQELAENPRVAVAFHWPALDRQVRIEGAVTRLSSAENDAYWATRALPSRLAAAVSRQSAPAASREAMDEAYATLKRGIASRPDGPARPAHWGGYRVWPQGIEFWQGRTHRFHDRIRFERATGGEWTVTRLWP